MSYRRIAWAVCVPTAFVLFVGACSSSDDAGASARAGSANDAGASSGGAPNAGGAANRAGAAGVSSQAGAPSADREPGEVSGMTAAHNAVRAMVTPAANPAIPPLAWSQSVATTAQAWADRCSFEHSAGKYGENIYAAAGKRATPAEVVKSWADEAAQYDYASNGCSGTCGHYTQVVWRKSVKLGCGVSNCTKNSPFSGFAEWQFWVCNYDPPGNFSGQKPY